MKRKTKILISTICALVMCFGIVGGVSAENVTEMKSKGIIHFTGDNVNDTSDDIVFDASDLTTLEQRVNNADNEVKQGKKSVADAMDSATSTSTSDTNKTKFNVSNDENYTNLPDYAKLVEGIAKVKAVGKEEGIAVGKEEGINFVWESIRNDTELSSKLDSDNNSIYAGVTDLDSLKSAITADNDNLNMKIVIDRIHHDGSGYADHQEIWLKIYIDEELKYDQSVGRTSSWYSPSYTVYYPPTE